MKKFNYTSIDNIEWEIEITYDSPQDTQNTGAEVVYVKSDTEHLRFTYPFQPLGLKFKIEPTTTDSDGNIIYGNLKYGDELVSSFDPEL